MGSATIESKSNCSPVMEVCFPSAPVCVPVRLSFHIRILEASFGFGGASAEPFVGTGQCGFGLTGSLGFVLLPPSPDPKPVLVLPNSPPPAAGCEGWPAASNSSQLMPGMRRTILPKEKPEPPPKAPVVAGCEPKRPPPVFVLLDPNAGAELVCVLPKPPPADPAVCARDKQAAVCELLTAATRRF